jgi:hypothetical protein
LFTDVRGLGDAARFLAALSVFAGAACSIDSRAVIVDAAGQTDADADVDAQVIEVCQGIPVQQALIADFSDAVEEVDSHGNAGVRYASGPVSRGGTAYFFAAPGLTPPRLSIQTTGDNRALRIDATPGKPVTPDFYWFGFALGFGSDTEVCLDATGFTGVGFTLDGTPGTCLLMFQVMISEDDRIGDGFEAASCTLGPDCYPPFSKPLMVAGPGSYAFPFTELAHGNPVETVDVKAITNVGWKMFAPVDESTPCEAHLVLDDVAFYR